MAFRLFVQYLLIFIFLERSYCSLYDDRINMVIKICEFDNRNHTKYIQYTSKIRLYSVSSVEMNWRFLCRNEKTWSARTFILIIISFFCFAISNNRGTVCIPQNVYLFDFFHNYACWFLPCSYFWVIGEFFKS